MTHPLGGDDADGDDDIAAVLLADAVAQDDAESDTDPPGDPAATDLPDTGATRQPDMGEPLTQPPATPPASTQPPAAQPNPAPPAAVPPATPAPPQPPASPPGPPQPGSAPATGTDPDYYPANTPLADMTAPQREAYWRSHARKHEDRVKAMSDYEELRATKEKYDALVTASQTEQERAVAEARRQGHAEAMQQAGGRLVEAYVRAAAAGRLDEQRVNALLEGMDRTRFLDQQTGEVAADRVTTFVHALAPAPQPAEPAAGSQQTPPQPATPPAPAPLTSGPDFGQGRQQSSRPTGLAAGRELARQRFGTNQPASA